MSERVGTSVAALVVLLGMFCGLNPCEARDAAVCDEHVAALEATFEAQQERIKLLQQQVAALQSEDLNAARSGQLKQHIREVLGESDFRESLMSPRLQAGYDKGFFIRSSDEKFLMKFQWQIQFRWTHYDSQNENRYLAPGFERSDRTGFDFARTRFRVLGHAYSKGLTYLIEITHAENTAYDAQSLYAYINYRFADEFNVLFGQMRLMGTRAQTRKITTYQLCELPVSDAVFGAGVGVGVRFWGKLFDKRLSWYLDVANSLSGMRNRTITPDPSELDGTPAILFRTIWHVLGENPGSDFFHQADFARRSVPAMEVGFHYLFDDNDGDAASARIPFTTNDLQRNQGVGAFGLTSSRGLQIHQFGGEAAFKYSGFSATSEFHVRMIDVRSAASPPYTPYFQLTGDDSTTTYYGGYLQLGYLLPIPGWEDKFEVVGRVEGIGGIDPGNEGTWVYTGGLNYYIRGNSVKLQTDITKVVEAPITSSTYSLANMNDDALIWRVQLSFNF